MTSVAVLEVRRVRCRWPMNWIWKDGSRSWMFNSAQSAENWIEKNYPGRVVHWNIKTPCNENE